jgi:hypothetical protein
MEMEEKQAFLLRGKMIIVGELNASKDRIQQMQSSKLRKETIRFL